MAGIPDQTASIFTETATATLNAQRALDSLLTRVPRSYAISSVRMRARFGLTEVNGRPAVLFGEKSVTRHENELRFDLNLAPEPLPAVPSVVFPSAQAKVPTFLVPPAQHKELVGKLKDKLTAADHKRFRTELQKLEAAAASRTHEAGLIFLALRNGRFLIVRLGRGNDGIFLLDEGAPAAFEVLSYSGMARNPLPWTLFHELFDMFRLWQTSRYPIVNLPAGELPSKIGHIAVTEFAQGFWSGYCKARQHLSDVTVNKSAMPSYYELRGVEAVLNYSVPPPQGGPQHVTPFIKSQVTVAIDDRDSPTPMLRIGLLAPEFILIKESRNAILSRLDDNLNLDESDGESLWSAIAAEYRSNYRNALKDNDRRGAAIVLLSYCGIRPKNEFLFVWPGLIDGEEREFAFRLRYDGEKLTSPEMVLPLENPLNDSGGGIPSPQRPFSAATVRYDTDYSGLHDFFHAVWIWTFSGGWF
ncbi:MAG: hypothetical protein JO108_33290 [Acidobacteriaceae bacterium]|nr:hypothetical protein [Acidobacteriaceae bacterium]